MQIEDYLYKKKLHQPLTKKKIDSMKYDEWNLLDRQVCCAIVVISIFFNIVKEKTSVNVMKALSGKNESHEPQI